VRTVCESRWFLPVFALALGGIFFAAQTIGGHFSDGLVSLGIILAFAAVFVFGGRSETIRGLRGDGREERFRQIDVNATAFAGVVVMLAVIGSVLVSLAQGDNGGPNAWLAPVAGFAYVAAITALRVRS